MHFKGLDLNLLVALDALLDEKSVTRAADRLCVTQPAMSIALRKLREMEDNEGIRSIEVRDNLRFGEGRDTRAVSD